MFVHITMFIYRLIYTLMMPTVSSAVIIHADVTSHMRITYKCTLIIIIVTFSPSYIPSAGCGAWRRVAFTQSSDHFLIDRKCVHNNCLTINSVLGQRTACSDPSSNFILQRRWVRACLLPFGRPHWASILSECPLATGRRSFAAA